MCNMFLIPKTVYFTGYLDDSTSFAVAGNTKDVVMQSLEEVGKNLNTWFPNNQKKLNPEKCHLLRNIKLITTKKRLHTITIKNITIPYK